MLPLKGKQRKLTKTRAFDSERVCSINQIFSLILQFTIVHDRKFLSGGTIILLFQ